MASNRLRAIRIEDLKPEQVPQQVRDLQEMAQPGKPVNWRRFWYSKKVCSYVADDGIYTGASYDMDAKGHLVTA